MIDIVKNIRTVQKTICLLEQQSARPKGSVRLIAVSKFHTISAIQQAYQTGIIDFGENYLQEAIGKISALTLENITWHFIGQIQSNKSRLIAEHFDWVHTVEKLTIAKRLNDARSNLGGPLNICLQVNIDGSKHKGGVSLSNLSELAHAVSKFPHIRLRGLMAIPDYQDTLPAQQAGYRLLAEAKAKLCSEGLKLDTLSMGMSQDLEAAISMGATMVRVGTAIFGPRPIKENK
jgi:PLP dependent protein